MSVKKVCLATLVTALLGLGAVRGQSSEPSPSPSATPTPGGLLSGTPGAPGTPPGYLSTRPADTTGATGDLTQPGQPVNLCLSDWIVGPHGPGCCGPVGGCGPIQEELYLQSGLDFPFSDGVFGHTLKSDGWVIQGGGRTLFFNPEQDAAWVVDLSISNVRDEGRNPTYEIPLHHILVPTATASNVPGVANSAIVEFVPRAFLNKLATEKTIQKLNPQIKNFKKYHGQPLLLHTGTGGAPNTIAAEGVSVADLNRTFFNVGFGRDWYLFGEAPTYLNRGCGSGCGDNGCGCGGPVWRVGVDGGGRYGTAKVELHEVRHRTDTIAGVFIGAHSDVEVPCGCCIFQAGVRLEWDYTWMDIFQEHNDADLEGINLLFTIGTRF
jgi:hypothetical protein